MDHEEVTIKLAFWTPNPDGSSNPLDILKVWDDPLSYFPSSSKFGSTIRTFEQHMPWLVEMTEAKLK